MGVCDTLTSICLTVSRPRRGPCVHGRSGRFVFLHSRPSHDPPPRPLHPGPASPQPWSQTLCSVFSFMSTNFNLCPGVAAGTLLRLTVSNLQLSNAALRIVNLLSSRGTYTQEHSSGIFFSAPMLLTNMCIAQRTATFQDHFSVTAPPTEDH